MTRSLLALSLVLLAAAASADGFHSLYIGEHQNSTPPTTGSAADYMESSPRQTISETGEEAVPAPKPQQEVQQHQLPPAADPLYPATVTPQGHAQITRVSSPDAPSAAPETAAPEKRENRIGGFIKRDPAAQRYYEGPAKDRMSDAIADRPVQQQNARAYKLWDSVAKPVQMNAAQVAKTPGIDDAASAAGAEYERRILGQTTAPQTGALSMPAAGSMDLAGAHDAVAAPIAASPANEVFVSIDVSATEQAGLKDAVAGLTTSAGFRPDSRFPPQSSSFAPGSGIGAAAKAATSLRGWMPADKISSAVTAPGVLRVQVDHSGPRPESASSAMTTLVVGLRIPAHASAGETFQQTINELSQTAKFRWTRTIGFQAVPNSTDVALIVVGEVPVTRIPKILENPGVLKIGPAPLEPGAPVEQPKTPSRLEDFFSFARQRAPLLIALTLLLLLPNVGGWLLKLGQAFVPYER